MLMKKFFLYLLLVPAMLVQADSFYTVGEIISIYNSLGLADGSTSTNTYTIRGYVTRWKSGYPTYQNADFFIDDDENGNGSTSLFECFRLTGSTDDDKHELSKGDFVEVTGKLKNFGGKAELVSGTFRVLAGEQWTPVPISISEFISRNDGKRYILTGVVTEIKSTQYGNLDLEDETGSIYVYGISGFSNYDIAVDDTLTISGIYQLYGSTNEVTGGQYISHTHPQSVIPPTPEGVDFETAFADGWASWIGQTVTFSNDFYFCYSTGGVCNVAPRRLHDPEEYGNEGTSEYNAWKAKNTNDSCNISNSGLNYRIHRYGTILRNVQAYIPAANQLQVVNTPDIIPNEFPTERPDLGDANVVICGANIENFFVYDPSDPTNLFVQKDKVAKALHHMNADIYALCEVEQGPYASQFLCDTLNALFGVANLFAYTNGGSSQYQNAAGVTFIYRTDRIEKVGSYIYPYPSYQGMKWRMGIQCFKHKATNEKFNISMNHFWAKINHGDEDREANMSALISYLPVAANNDPDILVLGDLNAYTMETSNQMLIQQKNYVDLLMKYAPEGYSHPFGSTVGYLDHAFCSPSMENQVTNAVPYHLNADMQKNVYGYTAGDHSMYRYSDHDPILVGLKLEGETPSEECTAINYSESFSTNLGEFERVSVDPSGSATWYWNSSYSCANVNGYNKGANEDYLISPAFDFTDQKSGTIGFEHAVGYGTQADWASQCKLLISDNYTGNVADATWTQLTIPVWGTSKNFDWKTNSIAIPAEFMHKSNIHFAFYYNVGATNAPSWEIKNFVVETVCEKVTTPIENVVSTEPSARKEIRHGQLIIIRGGEAFTVTGVRAY